MTQTKHAVVALLFILGASLSGCSAKDDPVDSTPIRLTTDAKDLTAFRGVSAVREDGAPFVLEKTEYQGTIGDVQVPMRFFDGGLAFLVPYGVVGSVELVVDLDGVKGVLPLDLLAPPEIADPVATVNAVFDAETAAFEEMNELLSELVELEKLPQSALDKQAELRAECEAIRQQFLEISPEEQRIAALAISIFKAELAPYDQNGAALLAALHSKSYDNMESMKPLVAEFIKHVAVLMAPVVTGFAAGAIISGVSTGGAFPWLGASSGAYLAANWFKGHIKRKLNDISLVSAEMVEVAFVPSDIMMEFFKSTVTFQGNEPVPAGIDVGWRNVRSGDLRSPALWISSFIFAIEKTNAFVDDYLKEQNRIEFAMEKREVEDPHSLSALKVVEISKPGVSCGISGSTDHPALRCKSSKQLSEPLKFTFRLEYKVDAFTLLSHEMTGALSAKSECDCREGRQCADCDGTPTCLGSGETCCGGGYCPAGRACTACGATFQCLPNGATCCGAEFPNGNCCFGDSNCGSDERCIDCGGIGRCLSEAESC